MTGQDVIVVHRLLKNTISEATGVGCYAFFSEAALDAIGLPGLAETMQRHKESYDHLGDVTGYVYDMHAFWTDYQAQQHVCVEQEEAWIVDEIALPVPPVLAWEYLTQAQYRQQWIGADSMETFKKNQGRAGVGMIEHCAHGKQVAVNEVVDWRPFDYVTYRSRLPLNGYFHLSVMLEPTDDGARATMRISKPKADHPLRNFLLNLLFKRIESKFKRDIAAGCQVLKTLIETDAEKHAALTQTMLSEVHVVLDD